MVVKSHGSANAKGVANAVEVAARLLEDMEKAGLVSAMSGNGNRDILAPAGTAREEE